MFRKRLAALLLTPLVTAFLAQPGLQPVPVDEYFLQVAEDADVDKESLELGSSLPAGTYPCIFKVGQSFYDYTPFKLALQGSGMNYGQAFNQGNTTQFVFGICQQLSQIPTSPCTGAVFAEANNWDPATCVAYSGGSYTDI